MITKTSVQPGSVGEKKGWCFSVYYGDKDYPNFTSALFKTRLESAKELLQFIKTGKFVIYGSAE